MEPLVPGPEYFDAVDVLKEQEQQIRELQNEINVVSRKSRISPRHFKCEILLRYFYPAHKPPQKKTYPAVESLRLF